MHNAPSGPSSSVPSASRPPPPGDRALGGAQYICNCVKHCKGIPRQVSQRKYELHAPFRVRPEDVLAHFQPQLAPAASSVSRQAHTGVAGRVVENLADFPSPVDDGGEGGAAEGSPGPGASVPVACSSAHAASSHRPAPLRHRVEDEEDDSSPEPAVEVQPEGEEEPAEDVGATQYARRKEVREAQIFTERLATARLDHSGMTPESLARLRSPRTAAVEVTPQERVGIRMFTARGDASEENYADNRAAFMELHPEDHIPTYEQVQRLVTNITGIEPIRTDMCVDTCVAFVGPFATLEQCPFCGEARYDVVKLAQGKRVPRRTYQTYPLGPQLQAMWGSPENARLMKHRATETRRIVAEARRNPQAVPIFDDIYYGQAYLDAVQSATNPIREDDMVLMFSIDGAQLYESKSSDCWFYVWVLFDLPPDARYKKRYVLPGAVIGGPKKPKNIDSFIFPGLYHIAALQREGLPVWDAAENRLFQSYLFLLLVTADGPAMAYLNGLVGHHGALGCRLYCRFLGRNKPGMSMYYPAALCPLPAMPSDHPDVSLRGDTSPASEAASVCRQRYQANLRVVESSPTNAAYARNRLLTGIAKPSIFGGIPRILGVPDAFGADLMHLICLNLTELIMGLLRGTLACEAPDDKSTWTWAIFMDRERWIAHGRLVTEATPYLPGSFDRPPRNPAEKISSGYKAWEYLLYVYGLLPGLLRGIQAPVYYRNFCKLVSAVRIILQRRIPPASLPLAHRLFIEHAEGIESLYYQRRRERLHFTRQSVHATTHIVPEIARLGPGTLYTQWTLENFIGNITREIKQHSTPYANVSERALRRCQVNALYALMPSLSKDSVLPSGALPLGGGYVLLRAFDSRARTVITSEGRVIQTFLRTRRHPIAETWKPLVRRWARLLLPTGQIARSAWKESQLEARGQKPRRARMIKLNGTPSRFAEVQYFFILDIDNEQHALAMLAPFSPPDPAILLASENTVLACTPPGEQDRLVVAVAEIIAVVAMVPLPRTRDEDQHGPNTGTQRFFVVEKPGLDVATLAGFTQDLEDVDGDLTA